MSKDQDTMAFNLALIVFRLMTNPRGWRRDDLLRELDIADRTYRKYRQNLREHFPPFQRGGVPLLEEVQDGDHRYLRLRRDVPIQLENDVPARITAIHFARHMASFLEKTDIGEALLRLADSFQRELQDQTLLARHTLPNLDRLLFLAPDASKDYWKQRELLRELLVALFQQERIEVDYQASNSEPGRRTLEPLSLMSWRGGLYLLARQAGSTRVKTFVVDRMQELKRLGVWFEYPSRQDFDPAHYTEGSFGIFTEDNDDSYDVELIFQDIRWLKVYLKERRWHPRQQFEELPDGRLQMTFRVRSMVEVWPWIRQFGEDVEVIKPGGGVPRGVGSL